MSEPNNPQYSADNALFGFPTEGITSTNAPGTSSPDGTPPPTLQHGQLGSGLPGHDLTHAEVVHTGAPGSAGQTPRPDGGSATVTDAGHSGIPEHGTKTGTTNTSKSAIGDALGITGSFGGGNFPDSTTNNKGGTAKTERP